MIDDDTLAETPGLLTRVLNCGAWNPVSRCQVHRILDYLWVPNLPLLSPDECQAVASLGSGAGPGFGWGRPESPAGVTSTAEHWE